MPGPGRIGNAWHIPSNVEPPGLMRNPLKGISPTSPVSILSGNQFQGTGVAGDQLQTGSAVLFRKAGGVTLPKRSTQADFGASDTGWLFDAPTGFVFVKFSHLGGTTLIRL